MSDIKRGADSSLWNGRNDMDLFWVIWEFLVASRGQDRLRRILNNTAHISVKHSRSSHLGQITSPLMTTH